MRAWLSVYLTPPMLLIGMLGFYSGLPLALTASTLTAWLADAGVERASIGLFAAVATPYAFKFLWAPLLDGARLPVLGTLLGRRRSWMLLAQLGLTASLCFMAFSDPAQAAGLTALAAVMVASCSATQDTAIDAYRVERLAPEEQGAGAAMATFGYRMGMLVAGAGALYLADTQGWTATYLIMAGLMGSGVLVTLLARRERVEPEEAPVAQEAALVRVRRFFRDSVIAPFKDFMTRPYWMQVLLFIILYKLGDAFMGVMFNPFLLDIGFTKTQIAQVVKLYGLIATLLGAFAGGAMVARVGTFKTLFLCGILNALTNLLFAVQASVGDDPRMLILAVTGENFTGGMVTAAFIAYLSALCKLHYTATQYALLSSLAAVGRTWLSTPSGVAADAMGWVWFFVLSAAMAIPSLILLWWLEKQKHRTP